MLQSILMHGLSCYSLHCGSIVTWLCQQQVGLNTNILFELDLDISVSNIPYIELNAHQETGKYRMAHFELGPTVSYVNEYQLYVEN